MTIVAWIYEFETLGEEFRAETEWIWIEATGAITESRKAINLYYYYPSVILDM